MAGASKSEIDLCNRAMDFIGEAPVVSISPPKTSSEKILARNFADTRQEALRAQVWNFAKTASTVSRTNLVDTAGDFPDVYQLPNDLIRFVSIAGLGESSYADYPENDPTRRYDIRGRQLYYDGGGSASIIIRYVKDVKDLSLWDATAKKLFALMLAANVGYAIGKESTIIARVNSLIGQIAPEAAAIDGQERPPLRIQRSKYLAARRMVGGSGDVTDGRIRFD